MSTNLEIETKVLITKENYEKLETSFKQYKTYSQINYYIGSKELIDKVDKYGLRIRKKFGNYELTLKIKEEIGKTEINQSINKKDLINLKLFNKFPQGEVKDFLQLNKICDTKKLKIIGKMKTLRKDISFNSSLISIDKSIYNRTTDYEIECEDSSLEYATENLLSFLTQNKIDYQKSEQTKLTRFLNTLD